jgi:hypothetical protein
MDASELTQVYEAFRKNGHPKCQSSVGEQLTVFLARNQPLLTIDNYTRDQIYNICKDVVLCNLNGRPMGEILTQELASYGIVTGAIDEEELCNHFLIPVSKVVRKLCKKHEAENGDRGKYIPTHLFFIYQGLFKKEHTQEEVCGVYHNLRCNGPCPNAAKIRGKNNLGFCSNECVDAYTSIFNI